LSKSALRRASQHREKCSDFYDLIPEDEALSTAIEGLLNAMNTRELANEISQLCLYDTSQMGAP
jgi:hypothetical protein